MIAKCAVVAHGCNAIRYAMTKRGSALLAVNHVPSDMFLSPPGPDDVWEAMCLRKALSATRREKFVLRAELCPAAEEAEGWGLDDWRGLLRDWVAEMDRTECRDSRGRVTARATRLANSIWIAQLHRDTATPHIHLVACGIGEDGRMQDTNNIGLRAGIAARRVSERRGWQMPTRKFRDGRAVRRANARKERVRAAAMAALRSMGEFSFREYFAALRSRGLTVCDAYDGRGRCVRYTVAEGKVVFKSSELPGRGLTPSRLPATWLSLHPEARERGLAADVEARAAAGVPLSAVDIIARHQRLLASAGQTENVGEYGDGWESVSVECPLATAGVMRAECQGLGADFDAVGLLSTALYMAAVTPSAIASAYMEAALSLGCDAAPPTGGGGGTADELTRWDGKSRDDLDGIARAAVRTACRTVYRPVSSRRHR